MQQSHSSLITVSDSASCSLLRRASLQSILLSDPSFHLKFSELIFKIEIKKNPLTLVDEYWGVKNDLIIKLNSSKNFDDNPNLVKLNEFQQLFFDYVVNMIFQNDLNQSSSVEVIEDQRVKLKFKIINQIFLDDSESVITLQKVADCDLGFNNFWKIDYPSNPVIFLYNPDNQNKPLTIYLSQDFISLYNPINDGDGVKSKIKCPTTRSIIDIDNSKIVFFVSSNNLDFRIINLPTRLFLKCHGMNQEIFIQKFLSNDLDDDQEQYLFEILSSLDLKFLINERYQSYLRTNKFNDCLLDQARRGNIENLKLLINSGVNLYYKDFNGDSVFKIAFRQNNQEILDFFWKEKFDKIQIEKYLEYEQDQLNQELLRNISENNIKNAELLLILGAGEIPNIDIAINYLNFNQDQLNNELILKANNDDLKSLEFIINLGAKVDFIDHKRKINALFLACDYNKIKNVELLIKSGADINFKNHQGMSAINLACSKNKVDLVKKLIELEADLTIVDDQLNNCLHYSCSHCDGKILEILIAKEVNLNAKNKDGETGFFIAIKKSNLRNIEILINAKANLEETNLEGESPFFTACMIGSLKVIERLIEAKVNLETRNNKGESPLFIACKNNKLEAIERLLSLQKGVDAELPNNEGESPFFMACKENKIEVVVRLIKFGIDIEKRNNQGETPLFTACINGNLEVVEELIDHGANILVKDNQGRSLFQSNLSPEIHRKLIEVIRNKGLTIEGTNILGISRLKARNEVIKK